MKKTLLLALAMLNGFSTTTLPQTKEPLVYRDVTEGTRKWICTLSNRYGVAFYVKLVDSAELPTFVLNAQTPKQLDELRAILKKLTEWDRIARDNKVERFSKIMGVIGSDIWEFKSRSIRRSGGSLRGR